MANIGGYPIWLRIYEKESKFYSGRRRRHQKLEKEDDRKFI
jgi:hypothetical protein